MSIAVLSNDVYIITTFTLKIIKTNFFNVLYDKRLSYGWRNLGDGVLGHASIGRGVVEVALGGYGCDGSFQLFTVDTVETIMTHELGHVLGLRHTDDPDSIMYPTMNEVNYSYCLLS